MYLLGTSNIDLLDLPVATDAENSADAFSSLPLDSSDDVTMASAREETVHECGGSTPAERVAAAKKALRPSSDPNWDTLGELPCLSISIDAPQDGARDRSYSRTRAAGAGFLTSRAVLTSKSSGQSTNPMAPTVHV